jgi:hypothetical protein
MDADSLTPPQKRKRRWFQFSLRALLIFTMACAVAAGLLARKFDRARHQQEVADIITKSGGRLTYDYETANASAPGPKWLRQLLGQGFFSDVVEVDFNNHTRISSEDLEQLKVFESLATLDLRDTNITNDELRGLSGLAQLKELTLAQTCISDSGLKYLKDLSGLQSLDLWDTQVTDAGLADLQSLTQLRELELPLTNRISDAGIDEIQRALPKCKIGGRR